MCILLGYRDITAIGYYNFNEIRLLSCLRIVHYAFDSLHENFSFANYMQIIGEKRCTLYFAGIFGDHFARSFLQHSFGSPSELIAIHLIIRFEHERRSHGDLRGHVPTNPSRKSIESRERRRRRCSTLRRAAPENFRHAEKTVPVNPGIRGSAFSKRPILLSRVTRV